MVKKIIIIGKTPPPLGGVTIHVERLKNLLENNNYNVEIIDYSNSSEIKKIINSENGIYHLHISNDFFRFAVTILLALQGKYVINTFHSYRNKSFIQKILCVFTSRISKKNIAVGSLLAKKLDDEGFEKVFLQEPFIPPTINEIIGLKCDLSSNRKFTIGINAYSLLLEDGEDIYGIMTSLIVLKKILSEDEHCEVYLNIYFSEIKDQKFYEEILNFIIENNLDKYVNMKKGKNLIREIPNLKLFIRPTLTDSYGISVSESIFLGVPAIASNVCKRDEKAIIYDVGNQEELVNKIKYFIKNRDLKLNENKKFESKSYLNNLYRLDLKNGNHK